MFRWRVLFSFRNNLNKWFFFRRKIMAYCYKLIHFHSFLYHFINNSNKAWGELCCTFVGGRGEAIYRTSLIASKTWTIVKIFMSQPPPPTNTAKGKFHPPTSNIATKFRHSQIPTLSTLNLSHSFSQQINTCLYILLTCN